VYSHFAARGEATTELPFTAGLASGITKPFRVATRGMGTLQTWMDASCAPLAVEGAPAPDRVALRVAGANPARGATRFEWAQPALARATLDVFSITGARIARLAGGAFAPGTHAVRWEPRGTGIYFVSLSLDHRRVATRRLVVMR
jgi:hypothetical protein